MANIFVSFLALLIAVCVLCQVASAQNTNNPITFSDHSSVSFSGIGSTNFGTGNFIGTSRRGGSGKHAKSPWAATGAVNAL